MAAFKISICDSNYNFIEEIVVDNAVIRPDLFIPQYHGGRNKTIKMRSYSDKLIRNILETNGHYVEFSIMTHQTTKRDGIMIKMPLKIKLITSVPDNIPLPEAHISEEERKMRHLLRMLSRIYHM